MGGGGGGGGGESKPKNLPCRATAKHLGRKINKYMYFEGLCTVCLIADQFINLQLADTEGHKVVLELKGKSTFQNLF